jgi:hypothetical protein
VVIVGGGPTGVEFAGELSNFIRSVSPLAFAPLRFLPTFLNTCMHSSPQDLSFIVEFTQAKGSAPVALASSPLYLSD